MSWTKFFDKIYVINLAHRDDRLLQVKWEMDKYGIPFDVVGAIKHEDGRQGIMQTLVDLVIFAACDEEYDNILVFEDDAKFLMDPSPVMERAIDQLPSDYDMLYLGVNLTNSYVPKFYSHNLLRIKRGLALHACAYSRKGMGKIMETHRSVPFDCAISDSIHPDGDSYAVYPMLATQRFGYSDIERKEVNYYNFLESRFYEQVSKNPDYKKHII